MVWAWGKGKNVTFNVCNNGIVTMQRKCLYFQNFAPNKVYELSSQQLDFASKYFQKGKPGIGGTEGAETW